MRTSVSPTEDETLLTANTPRAFWGVLDEGIETDDWRTASEHARHCLAGLPVADDGGDPVKVMEQALGEGQFGPRHWQLSRPKRLYYALRPVLPEGIRPLLRRAFLTRQRTGVALDWPVEDRYVRYQFELMRQALMVAQRASVPAIHFWPQGKQFAFVLTHDVESQRGHDFVRELVALEEKYGFRSAFNFVPQCYQVDSRLRGELRERGFEVGVHGLKHDGKLYASYATFCDRAQRINDYLQEWQAIGFRSPMTHRHPMWMQALNVEYDSSFFDTDPFEPIPGGTMSIWPYTLGRFIELPYTLSQDHTLMVTLAERSPKLWLEKVAFIAQHSGLALLNAHPDYLLVPKHLAIYESFLQQMQSLSGYWHALPRNVARWWRWRASVKTTEDVGEASALTVPQPTVGYLTLTQDASLMFCDSPSLTPA